MLRAALRSLLAHKVRLGLTALAVVLGVSFIVGTYVLTDTINATFENLFRDVSSGTDVYVRSEAAFESQFQMTRQPVDEEVLDTVLAVPGVSEADGTVQGFAQLIDKEGEAIVPSGPPTLGVNWSNTSLNPLTLRSGDPPRSDDQVAIDASTARRFEFGPGDQIRIV
ncbi:MAG TPA: ABC transporter permease, partial [Actinomycetota bacterium]|nr:ABC transporter permease [Actinomycetota bacterium]